MAYFVRQGVGGHSAQIWKIDSDSAIRVGVANAKTGAGTYFKANAGETIWDSIRKNTPWFEPDGINPFHETKLSPGQYYSRIARPIEQHPEEAPGWYPGHSVDADSIAISRSQLDSLALQLRSICRTVHPAPETFDAFGHDIRNILILACTEVEAQWRGVLRANGSKKDRYTTRDYVLLRDAMRLDEYSVFFPEYPWLDEVRPYASWCSANQSTTALPWYDAYHAVKHNREEEFRRASLHYAFEALSACFVMIAAQFGHGGCDPRSAAGSFFQFSKVPSWPLPEVYISPYEAERWSPVAYPFPI